MDKSWLEFAFETGVILLFSRFVNVPTYLLNKKVRLMLQFYVQKLLDDFDCLLFYVYWIRVQNTNLLNRVKFGYNKLGYNDQLFWSQMTIDYINQSVITNPSWQEQIWLVLSCSLYPSLTAYIFEWQLWETP